MRMSYLKAVKGTSIDAPPPPLHHEVTSPPQRVQIYRALSDICLLYRKSQKDVCSELFLNTGNCTPERSYPRVHNNPFRDFPQKRQMSSLGTLHIYTPCPPSLSPPLRLSKTWVLLEERWQRKAGAAKLKLNIPHKISIPVLSNTKLGRYIPLVYRSTFVYRGRECTALVQSCVEAITCLS